MLWMLTGVHINQRPAPKKKQQLHRNGHNVWYGPVSKFSLPCTFHCSRSRPHFIESDQQISIFICSSPPTSIDGVTLVSRTAIKRFTSSNSIQWIFFSRPRRIKRRAWTSRHLQFKFLVIQFCGLMWPQLMTCRCPVNNVIWWLSIQHLWPIFAYFVESGHPRHSQ